MRKQPLPKEVCVWITSLDSQGRGVGTSSFAQESLLIKTKGLLPGETAQVEIEYQSYHKHEAYAQVKTRNVDAPERFDPKCPAYGACGGCVLQHLAYPSQLLWKQTWLQQALDSFRIKPKQSISPCFPASNQGYEGRRQAKFVVAQTKQGIILGSYAPHSHQVIDMKGCKLIVPSLNELTQTITSLLNQNPISVYHEKSQEGLLRYVIVRETASQEIQLIWVVTHIKESLLLQKLSQEIQKQHPQLQSVILHENSDPGNALFSRQSANFTEKNSITAQVAYCSRTGTDSPENTLRFSNESIDKKSTEFSTIKQTALDILSGCEQTSDLVLLGSPWLWEKIGPISIRFSPRSFMQANHTIAQKMYEDIANILAPTSNDHLLDLYCGVGGIGLTLLQQTPGMLLTGIEDNPFAVEDAKAALSYNQIDPQTTQFLCGDAKEILSSTASTHPSPEQNTTQIPEYTCLQKRLQQRPITLVSLNPPRRGCDPEVLQKLIQLQPRALAYVSCNPETLARDLAMFVQHGYQVIQVNPYDLHPHSPHIESLTLLCKSTK